MKNNGFTMVETIIVITIVCIITLIATPAVKQYYINCQIEKLKSDIKTLENAGMMYYFDHGEYPINYENLEDFVINLNPNKEDKIISKLIMNVYASSPEIHEAVKVASIDEEKLKNYIGKLNYEVEDYVMTTKGTVLHDEGIPDINGHLIHHPLESEDMDLEDIINKEQIVQGGKRINNDRPNPPSVEIIEDVNVTVDGGSETEVKLGVSGDWYDSPHTFSDLIGEYVVYSRYKETDTHYASKTSYATMVKIFIDEIDEGNEDEKEQGEINQELTLDDISIGSIVYDPNWEWEHRTRDNYSGSGITKPIKWIVVAKNHYAPNQVTLMTEEIIAKQVFDNSTDRGSNKGLNHWGTSGEGNAKIGIRSWLNEVFYNTFTDNFKAQIMITNVPNNYYNGSYTTQDKVFLPSATELGEQENFRMGEDYGYFDGEISRLANLSNNTNSYWTRSISNNSSRVAVITRPQGKLNHSKSSDSEGVRPVINLKSNTLLQEDGFGNYIIKYRAGN